MYFKDENIYISDQNHVLFDLNQLKVYQLDEEHYNQYRKGNNLCDFSGDMSDPLGEFNIEGIKINVCHLCNLSCSYCYAGDGEYHCSGMMTIETAETITDRINELFPFVHAISFFGGEPTLNYEVIKYFCENLKNKRFMIQTNGMLLNDPKYIELFKKYDFIITLSLDGPKDIHDKYRKTKDGKPTYDIIKNNVSVFHSLTNKRINAVQSTYCSSDYSKQEVAESIYNNFGIDFISINNVMNHDIIQNGNLNKKIDECTLELKNIEDNDKYFISLNVSNILAPLLTKYKSKYFCEGGRKLVSIDPNGDFWACHLFVGEGTPICNIYDGVQDILRKISEYAYRLHSNHKGNNRYCESCIARYHCKKCLKDTFDDQYYETNCKRKQENTIQCLEWFSTHFEYSEKIAKHLI